jgi:hypothetical protein
MLNLHYSNSITLPICDQCEFLYKELSFDNSHLIFLILERVY